MIVIGKFQKQEILSWIESALKFYTWNDQYTTGVKNGLRLAKSFIDEEEPEFEDVEKAEWINGTHCSKCGWAMEDDVVSGTFYHLAFPYCPMCGTPMVRK